MEETLRQFLTNAGIFLRDNGVITLNGFLYLWYAFVAALPWVLSALGCAGTLVVDQHERALLTETPSRHGVEAPRRPVSWQLQYTTLLTLVLWIFASLLYPPPTPWIGAVMWLALPLAVLSTQRDRMGFLHNLKRLVLTYAAALLGVKFVSAMLLSADVNAWADTLGSQQLAANALNYSTGIVITLGTWAILYGIPFAYASYLFKYLTSVPGDVTMPWHSAADAVRSIRYRE